MKKSVEERASAVSKAEEGAADLKRKVAELSESLEKYEKEHQVNTISLYWFSVLISRTLSFSFVCIHLKVFAVITMVRVF